MAGNYPDVPSYRMAYDRDGTQVFVGGGNVFTYQYSSAELQAINDESSSVAPGNGTYSQILIIFPELRDLDGTYFAFGAPGPFGLGDMGAFEYSVNTTNGSDGTWVALSAPPMQSWSSSAARNTIQSRTVLGIRAVRLSFFIATNRSSSPAVVHLYGEIAPTQNPNRLALWHPTLDQRVIPSHFDWGDVPRSSSADKTFRVKNLSASLSANSIRVAQDVLTDAVPSVPGQHTLSTDGLTFLAQVNVGTLAPGAISAITTLRRITPSNAQMSVWAHRVFAEANSWS